MVDYAVEIIWELSYEAGYIKIGVDSVTQSKVISFCQDFNTVWESTLTTDTLLESSTSCSSTVDFSIKQTFYDKLGG